jgi:hypothetical protein
MTVTIDGSAGITTPGLTDSAALALTGTGSKVTGDFTNATVASRNSFQTSTTNGSTGIYALPNGTSTAASWQETNAADPTNASKILIATNGSTDVQLVSGINGSGTYLPLSFYTNGAEKMRIDTSGNLQVGGTTVTNTTGYVNSRTNARAWVNFNGSLSGTITPRANYNASSVTKNSAGDFTINFTVALADANYACGWSSIAPDINTPNVSTIVSQTTSAVRVTFLTYNAGPYSNPTTASIIVFGN